MDVNSKQVNIEKLSDITAILENLIGQGFGPQGRQTLMSTSTGHVTVTNSGCLILNALHFAHPVAKMIVESVDKTVSYTGDGSKTYVLYLNSFLQNVKSGSTMATGVSLARSIQLFQRDVYPKLVRNLLEHSELLDLSRNIVESEEQIKTVFRNVLFPHYSVKLVEDFAVLLKSALTDQFTTYDEHFCKRLDLFIDNFDSFVMKVTGLPYSACRVIEPFVIQRNFATLHQVNFEEMENIKFVMCTCAVEDSLSQDGFSEVISLSSNANFAKFMQFQRMRVEKFVKCCSHNSIQIVLCTEKIPDYALEIFTSHNISVIHCVLEEDINFMECLLGKQAIVYIKDTVEENNICEAKACKSIILNGRKYVHLVLDRVKYNLPKMLIATSPTQGLCNQLSLMLKRCLKSLYLCNTRKFQDSNILEAYGCAKLTQANFMHLGPSVITLSGGGCFEILCHNFLVEYSKVTQNSDLAEFCTSLGKAMLQCPRLLHRNNSIMQENLCKDFMEKFSIVQQDLKDTQSDGEKAVCFGVDRRGNIKDMKEGGVSESLSVKLFIFNGLLQLLQTLLRIDNIVGIQKKEDLFSLKK